MKSILSNHDLILARKAFDLALDKQRLLKELKSRLSCMNEETRKHFKHYVYDFDNKMLISEQGKYAFVWRVRKYPDKEIAPNNQQTSTGYTEVVLIKDLETL